MPQEADHPNLNPNNTNNQKIALARILAALDFVRNLFYAQKESEKNFKSNYDRLSRKRARDENIVQTAKSTEPLPEPQPNNIFERLLKSIQEAYAAFIKDFGKVLETAKIGAFAIAKTIIDQLPASQQAPTLAASNQIISHVFDLQGVTNDVSTLGKRTVDEELLKDTPEFMHEKLKAQFSTLRNLKNNPTPTEEETLTALALTAMMLRYAKETWVVFTAHPDANESALIEIFNKIMVLNGICPQLAKNYAAIAFRFQQNIDTPQIKADMATLNAIITSPFASAPPERLNDLPTLNAKPHWRQ